MAMDSDFDFTFGPSETIYPRRAVRIDPLGVNEGQCYLGQLNSRCIGVTPDQTEFAPGGAPTGVVGITAPPFILAQVGDNSQVPVYGEGRRCLIDIDPAFAGQVAPNDLIVSSNSGYGTKATPTGPWNQWIIMVALTVANGGQACLGKVTLFPWSPTGS